MPSYLLLRKPSLQTMCLRARFRYTLARTNTVPLGYGVEDGGGRLTPRRTWLNAQSLRRERRVVMSSSRSSTTSIATRSFRSANSWPGTCSGTRGQRGEPLFAPLATYYPQLAARSAHPVKATVLQALKVPRRPNPSTATTYQQKVQTPEGMGNGAEVVSMCSCTRTGPGNGGPSWPS